MAADLANKLVAGLQAAMPYYYRGRQILAATCANQDDFAAQAQALLRTLISETDNPECLAQAYEQWQAKRQAPAMP